METEAGSLSGQELMSGGAIESGLAYTERGRLRQKTVLYKNGPGLTTVLLSTGHFDCRAFGWLDYHATVGQKCPLSQDQTIE